MIISSNHTLSLFKRSFILVIFTLSGYFTLGAQTLDQAREMIHAKDYQNAKEAFSKLIKQHGSRADVNKWYGESLYETGDYKEAEKYLKIAANRKVPGAMLYLGKLYQHQYQFTSAISWIEKYLLLVKKDPIALAEAELLLDQCELGSRAIKRIEKVQIIDSIVVDRSNFLDYYKLSSESGKLLNPALLGEKYADRVAALFMSQRGDRRVFGMENGANRFDIFTSNKLLGDSWSEPAPISNSLNTEADENYPFVMNDGLTLYFASNAEPSIGGYDLFITRFNVTSNSYLTPERLPMPFNSPFNDYMIAIDEGNNVGWFASDRYQPDNQVIIYLFIPEEDQIDYYREIEEKQAINLAKITSIRDTWVENTSYEKLLQSVYAEQVDHSRQKGELLFPINDLVLYTSLSQFESSAAREQYLSAQKRKEQLEDIQFNLDELRLQWHKGNAATQNRLRAQILQLEEKLQELEKSIPELEMRSRNMEIIHLRSKTN